jgi:hypothetical protein
MGFGGFDFELERAEVSKFANQVSCGYYVTHQQQWDSVDCTEAFQDQIKGEQNE